MKLACTLTTACGKTASVGSALVDLAGKQLVGGAGSPRLRLPQRRLCLRQRCQLRLQNRTCGVLRPVLVVCTLAAAAKWSS